MSNIRKWILNGALVLMAVLVWFCGRTLMLASPEAMTWMGENHRFFVFVAFVGLVVGLVAVFLVYGWSGIRRHATYRAEFMDQATWNEVGSAHRGKTPFSDKLAAAGARPGEKIIIDDQGNVRVLGRKPEVVIDNTK